MKKFIYILLPLIISCNNYVKQPVITALDTIPIIDTTIIEDGDAPIAGLFKKDKTEKQKKEKISCSFGFKKFNTRKRPIEEAPGGTKGKKPKPPTDTTPPPPPPPTSVANTIYLNFWGKTISGTMWNASGTFTVQDAGLSQSEIDYILSVVKTHYQDYIVNVTTSETEYNAAPYGHKIEILITEDWEWYGQAGGVAYLNSFFWTDGSPAFVFSTLLNYNAHNIAEAAAHEAGHTLGLRHQSLCDSAGNFISQYNWGDSYHAPTMGASYNVIIGEWYPDGPTPLGCSYRQNDPAILTSALGLKL